MNAKADGLDMARASRYGFQRFKGDGKCCCFFKPECRGGCEGKEQL